MTVAVVMDFPGGTLDQYDEVIGKMKFTPGGKGAPGALSHWVTKTDSGLRVTDVWENRETFDKFAQEQIGPFAAESGMGAPEMAFYDVHNYLTPG